MNDFFERLSNVMSDGMTINLTIAKKGERLNVLYTPLPKDKKKEDVTPLVLRGTGPEIDVVFGEAAFKGTAALAGMTDNAKQFLKNSGAGEAKAEATGPGLFDAKGGKIPPTAVKPSAPPASTEPAPVAPPVAPVEPAAPVVSTPDPVNEPNTQFEKQGEAKPVIEGQQIGAANMDALKQAAQTPTAPPVQPAATQPPVQPAAQPPVQPAAASPQPPSNNW